MSHNAYPSLIVEPSPQALAFERALDAGSLTLAHLSITHSKAYGYPEPAALPEDMQVYYNYNETLLDFGDGLQRSLSRARAVRSAIESGGDLPLVDNGYSFVIDTRPEGKEADNIPPLEYTTYFAQRQIPIAAPGHRQYQHDTEHVPNYQDMFTCTMLADVVQQAAQNALDSGDHEQTRLFTGAMDGLGDAMRNLSRESTPYIGSVNAVPFNLRKLTKLYGLSDPGMTDEDSERLCHTIGDQLGVSAYRRFATNRDSMFMFTEYEGFLGDTKPFVLGSLSVRGIADTVETFYKP